MNAQAENNVVQIREPEQLTAKEVRTQVNLVQEVMQAVMKNGTHYGKIPGCGDKPTLLKPGAEKLASTFRLAINPEIEDLSTKDVIKYRVRAIITHQVTGAFLGAGVGTCSSAEEKYYWRNSVCDEEYDDTPEDRRRIKYKKSYGKIEKLKQVRTNQADLDNTVLKISKKRSLVDGILTVTGASDIFTQDIEDLPEELLDKKKEQKSSQDAPEQDNSHPSDPGPACPKCGAKMFLRPSGVKADGKPYPAFWSCVTYPECKGTLKAEQASDPEPRQPGQDG